MAALGEWDPQKGEERRKLLGFPKVGVQRNQPSHEIILVLKYCSEVSMFGYFLEQCIQYKLMKFSGVMITLLQYIDLKQVPPRDSRRFQYGFDTYD